MKRLLFVIKTSLILVVILLVSCDEVYIIEPRSEPVVKRRNAKPRTPVELGTIRGYFDDEYLIFDQHIEKIQPVDSFSNCYFYGTCNGGRSNQINLIRCNSTHTLAIFVQGYSVDSLPVEQPVKQEFGKYAEVQFYSFGNWNIGDPGFKNLISFYGKNVFITDVTDDVLTGTFEGLLGSSSGGVWVRDGEFKIKIFRKDMSCGK